LVGLAAADLHGHLADLRKRNWTDDRLCREIADHLATLGWVARVNFVRRTGNARFEVSASYRLPAAMVQQGGDYFLVDRETIRLPGRYIYDSNRKVIQGVEGPVPEPGARWDGDDVRAGLAILVAIDREPFGRQLTGVSVDNFEGRRNPRASHIELVTDRAGGRIRWGSAPGLELEENLVEQKLALLRENYDRTGRADAQHAVIDVSTFPDRYTIPG
jgi:hypothetical protein